MSTFVMRPASTTQPNALAQSIDDLPVLHEWKNAGHGTKPYSPDPMANESEIVRKIGYSSAHSSGGFRWTQRLIQKAMQLHDDRIKARLGSGRGSCGAESVGPEPSPS
jgi:hypothetical protein